MDSIVCEQQTYTAGGHCSVAQNPELLGCRNSGMTQAEALARSDCSSRLRRKQFPCQMSVRWSSFMGGNGMSDGPHRRPHRYDLDEARALYVASPQEDDLPIPAPFCQRAGTQRGDLTRLLALAGRRGCLIPWQVA
jgi:hypothetical protein